MSTRIQIRRDTTANWAALNPVLAAGEFGYETDSSKRLKIGDGSTAWNSLSDYHPAVAALADSATKLATPRTINGVAFDGTANITVTAAAATLTGTSLPPGVVTSSLTAVGTIATGVWQGTQIQDTYLAQITTAGKVANSATTATSNNTASAIITRDANGDFSARNITAALIGNASTATAIDVSGVTGLLSGGKIATNLLPALAISETSVVASQAAMLALVAQQGDIAVRTDLNKSFILAGTDPSILGNWQELLTPTDAVLSVAGKTGAVTLVSADITDATSSNTASRVVIRDASGNFSAGTITAALAGNASTATALANARTLWSVSFDGSANVTAAPTFGAGATVSSGQTLTLTGATVTGLTAASVGAGTFPGGAYGFTGATTLTGGAGNMVILAGTGNSRTMALQTTSAGGVATTALTLNADQTFTFAAGGAFGGAATGTTAAWTNTADTDTVTISPTHATYTHVALKIAATRAANVAYDFLNFTANAVQVFRVYGNGDTVTGAQIYLGGITASFGSLKRSGAGLEARLGDDSDYTTFRCAGLTATTITAAGALSGVTSFGMSGKQTITGAAATTFEAFQVTGTTTAANYSRWTNTSGDLLIGVESSAGNVLVATNGVAYSAVINVNVSKPLVLAINGSTAQKIGTDLSSTFYGQGAFGGTLNPLGNGGTQNTLSVFKASGTGYLTLASDLTAGGSLIGSLNFGTTGASTNVTGASINCLLNGSGATNASADLVFYTRSGAGFNEVFRALTTAEVQFTNTNTTASAANAYLDGGASNRLYRSTSSLRYKKWIGPMSADEARDIVSALNADGPTGRAAGWYHSLAKADKPALRYIGFNAERGAEINTALVTFNAKGQPDGFMYDRMTVPHNVLLENHETRLRALEAQYVHG